MRLRDKYPAAATPEAIADRVVYNMILEGIHVDREWVIQRIKEERLFKLSDGLPPKDAPGA